MAVDKQAVFIQAARGVQINAQLDFLRLISDCDQIAKQIDPNVSTQALSNCHGDWYEWLLAIYAWNISIQHNLQYTAVNLPNISQFDSSSLYQERLLGFVVDLRRKLQPLDVSLITSNPDFVIVRSGLFEDRQLIQNIDPESIDKVTSIYQSLVNKCDFNDIKGYMSAKYSLRPDRRLQIAHEGSLMKALYAHLQTRDWVLDARGISYFAVSTSISDADIEALKTIATHSITNVNERPKSAVDTLYAITDGLSANQALATIQR